MSEEREDRERRRRARRNRSGFADLAAFPMAFTETLSEAFGASMRPGRFDTADILEMLGDTEEERIESVKTMLRNSSDEDIARFIKIAQTAVAQVAQERMQEKTNNAGPENRTGA